MGVFTFVKAGKQLFNTIKGVQPKVNKTKLDTAKSELAKSSQKLKGSTAKLKQTQFEIKNKLPITFNKTNVKTKSNTEKAKKAFKKEDKKETKTKHYYVPENFNKGGRVGKKFGGGADMGSKKLSPKQMKIASLAGNKKKIDKPDFKKLRAMKSPMDKTVRKA
jgi:hypothetical protein